MNKSESLVANGRSQNRVALVTGARIGGISCAIAQRLLQADWTVILGDRDREAGSAAMKMLVRQGCKRVCFSHCDFSEELQVAGLMDRIRRRFGKVDLLVNTSGSAGNPLDDNLANLTPAALKNLFRDNVVTFYNMTRAVVTQFMQHQATGGVVITLSTNNGILGIRGQMGYGAVKQSLLSFCKALTVAYAARGIRFLVVSPGVVLTNSQNWQRRLSVNPAWPGIEGSLNPSGKMVTPDDVANVVLDVCSDRWRMVNGTEIVVDGGERSAGGDTFEGLDVNDYRTSAVRLARTLCDPFAERSAA